MDVAAYNYRLNERDVGITVYDFRSPGAVDAANNNVAHVDGVDSERFLDSIGVLPLVRKSLVDPYLILVSERTEEEVVESLSKLPEGVRTAPVLLVGADGEHRLDYPVIESDTDVKRDLPQYVDVGSRPVITAQEVYWLESVSQSGRLEESVGDYLTEHGKEMKTVIQVGPSSKTIEDITAYLPSDVRLIGVEFQSRNVANINAVLDEKKAVGKLQGVDVYRGDGYNLPEFLQANQLEELAGEVDLVLFGNNLAQAIYSGMNLERTMEILGNVNDVLSSDGRMIITGQSSYVVLRKSDTGMELEDYQIYRHYGDGYFSELLASLGIEEIEFCGENDPKVNFSRD
tara:strand:+ start:469 stop:1500 length:1032 start_codon:yes stop_codon:yes gene_type:complete